MKKFFCTFSKVIAPTPYVYANCFNHPQFEIATAMSDYFFSPLRLVYTQPILFSNFKGHCLSKGYVTKAPVKVVDERDFFECEFL